MLRYNEIIINGTDENGKHIRKKFIYPYERTVKTIVSGKKISYKAINPCASTICKIGFENGFKGVSSVRYLNRCPFDTKGTEITMKV